MNSQWGNITHRAGIDVFAGAILKLNDAMEYVLADASATTALFVAVADCDKGVPCAARSTSASTGSAEMTAIAGTYAVGALVFAAAGGKVSATGTRAVGYYVGEKKTTTADSQIEVVFCDKSTA